MSLKLVQALGKLNKWKNLKDFHRLISVRSYAISSIPAQNRKTIQCNLRNLKISSVNSYNFNLNYKKYATQIDLRSKQGPVTVEILLTRINSQYEVNGQVNGEFFKALLDVLEATPNKINDELTNDQIAFLLGACCPQLMPSRNIEERLDYFQRLWTIMEQNNKLNHEHFIIKLKIFKENRIDLPDHKLFLQQALTQPDREYESELYDSLLEVACANGITLQASEIMKEMSQKNFPLKEINFNALLLCQARNNNLDGTKEVLENMNAAGLTLSLETQTILALGFLENQQPANAIKILDTYKGQFNPIQILTLLRTLKDARFEQTVIERLVEELPRAYLQRTEVPIGLRNVIIELLYSK